MPIRIGTRSSNLAMWQARTVASALNEAGIETEIVQFKSMGDRSLGGNLSATVGQFIHLIDQKLKEGLVDIAVHSSKDVPTTPNDAIANLAYMERGVTNDLILFKRQNDEPSLYDVLDDANQHITFKIYSIELSMDLRLERFLVADNLSS